MTISEYIKGRFHSFGIELSEADLLDMCITLNADDTITKDNITEVRTVICKFIPSLLARPNSVIEGGMTVSWDKSALKSYYDALCEELDLDNMLSPGVTFTRL